MPIDKSEAILYVLFFLNGAVAGLVGYEIYDNHDLTAYDGQAFKPKLENYQGVFLNKHNLSVWAHSRDVTVNDVYLSNIAYTGSMRPTIYGGNKVMMQKYKGGAECKGLQTGMIISFDGKYLDTEYNVLHRIVSIPDDHPGWVFTKGDANMGNEFVDCEDIIGLAVGVLYT